jgi:GNAT superfamily N-acetyltransferase
MGPITGLPIEPVELLDGTAALVSPIRPTDADALARFHSLLTPATVYSRFFGYHLSLSTAEIEWFTNVDGIDRVALVVKSTSDDVIAVGRYDRMDDPSVAEVAFVVADAYQHQGLGTLLLARLVQRAQARGIATFYAQTLVGNQPMLSVFRCSGYPIKMSTSLGVIEVYLNIASVSHSRAHIVQRGTDHTSRVPPLGARSTTKVAASFSALFRGPARPRPVQAASGSTPIPSSTISRITDSPTVTDTKRREARACLDALVSTASR